MKTKENKTTEKYFTLHKVANNLFSTEIITVENDKVVHREAQEPTYLPIAFDKIRKLCGQSYFEALKNV